jgi:NTP pyrophosphatase (non-canonical NTP hydrolase)
MEKSIKEIMHFRDQKGWKKHHKEKDLAISIVLEASELLETFQWKTSEEATTTTK